MNNFKLAVSEAVRQHFPEELEGLQSLSEAAWVEYKEALEQYFGGEYRSAGWYNSICDLLEDAGADKNVAHVLACVRGDVKA